MDRLTSADDVRSVLQLSGPGTGGTGTVAFSMSKKVLNSLIQNEVNYALRL